MADVIPFVSVFIISLQIQRFNKTKRKYILHTNKENNICNIVLVLFQQLLANKHHRLHDSKFCQDEVWVWSPTNKNKNKPRVKHEPRSAHGHAVNKQTVILLRL